ncbi:hypothetical protein ScPMuIL_001332 [Solemya velum]
MSGHVRMNVKWIAVVSLLLNIQSCETENAGVFQTRINPLGLNGVGKSLMSSETVTVFDVLDNGEISSKTGDIELHFTGLAVYDIGPSEFSVSLPQENTFVYNITVEDIRLRTSITIGKTNTSNRSHELGLGDLAITSTGKLLDIDMKGVNRTKLSICSCSCTYSSLSGGWYDVLPTEANNSRTALMGVIEDLFCPVAKTAFENIYGNTFGFPELAYFKKKLELFHFGIKLNQVGIRSNLFIATYQLTADVEEIIKSYTMAVPVEFPPISGDQEKQVYILIKEDILSDLYTLFSFNDGGSEKSLLVVYETVFGLLNKEMKAEKLFMFPEITDAFEDGFVDFHTRNVFIWAGFEAPSVYLYLSGSVDVVAFLKCSNKNLQQRKTGEQHIFTIDLELKVPVQIGFNDSQLLFRLMNFGGNLTIRNSSIGNLTVLQNKDFRRLLYFVPRVYGEETVESFNKKVRGISISTVLPDGISLRNVNLSLEQGFVILEADIREISNKEYLQSDIIWIGHYDEKEHFILLEDQTLNATTHIEQQRCPTVVSDGNTIYGTPNVLVLAMTICWVLSLIHG